MSDEDIKKYKNILNILFRARIEVIESYLCIDLLTINSTKFVFDNCYLIISTIFGIKDTFNPINEYIIEIKDSEQYKIFTSECRCNNCMSYFESDDDLKDLEDEDGEFKGCPECNTDAYLMDLSELK